MNMWNKIIHSDTLVRLHRMIGQHFGLYFKVRRFTPSQDEPLRTSTNIIRHGINYVIDVGANKGQFGQSLFDFGYHGRVLSFEPVSVAFRKLARKAARWDGWEAQQYAIGNQHEDVPIHIAHDSVFSSLLKIKEEFLRANPKSGISKVETVPMRKLDNLILEELKQEDRLLLKIDTQGYEREVLEGAVQLIPHLRGLKIEIPLYSIYEESDFTFYEIIAFVKKHGFSPYSFNVEGVDLHSGRVNTIDGLFFRNDIDTPSS